MKWEVCQEGNGHVTLQWGDGEGFIVSSGYDISGECPPEAWDQLMDLVRHRTAEEPE